MKWIVLVVLACAVVVTILGCGKSNSRYVGRWSDYQNLLVLMDDHTGTFDGVFNEGGAKFSWKEDGSRITFADWTGESPYVFGEVSVSGEMIHIGRGEYGGLDLKKEKE
jgi:hypothetical protein